MYGAPVKHQPMIKKQYFGTTVDDHSRFFWICLIQSKVEVHSVLKDF